MVTVSADQKIRIRLKAYDHKLLDQSADDGKVLGQDPVTGRDIVAKAGIKPV